MHEADGRGAAAGWRSQKRGEGGGGGGGGAEREIPAMTLAAEFHHRPSRQRRVRQTDRSFWVSHLSPSHGFNQVLIPLSARASLGDILTLVG